MVAKRGRPARVDSGKVKNVLLTHKQSILREKGKIVSKLDAVWQKISDELSNEISPLSLYTFVTCNRDKVRDLLTAGSSFDDSEISLASNNITSEFENSCNDNEDSIEENSILNFTFSVPKEEFKALITEKLYKRKVRNRVTCRGWKVLRPGIWEALVTDKIWHATRRKCGFNFRNHYIALDEKSGIINGVCRCGNVLRIEIQDCDDTDITFLCKITPGPSGSKKSRCAKVYLRQPNRKDVAIKLTLKPVEIYRAEEADKLMNLGDPEPPHLPKSSVLHTARYEYTAGQFLDSDPIKAILKMKATTLQEIIHNVGADPFYVHYWTNHQNHVYKNYMSSKMGCVCIDATGGVCKRIFKANGKKSSHIFLYICVVNSEAGQFPVSQMLSETHNTNTIQYWLMEWVRSGCPPPKEVVTDSSRALLTAVVRCFTRYKTIEEYADACKTSALPNCYVRIDVAHFVKNCSSYLKNLRRSIRIFYLASIGALVRSTKLEESRVILHDILTVALNEKDGQQLNGDLCLCEEARNRLTNIITGSVAEVEAEKIINEVDEINDQDVDNSAIENKNGWLQWAEAIRTEVESARNCVGNRENAYFLPCFADRLMQNMKLFPLWSCVCRDQFGYGRVPASSAPVEGEFNKIKNIVLKGVTSALRPDCFIEKHLNYVTGKVKIVNAAATACDEPITDKNHSPDREIADLSKQAAHFVTMIQGECPACANGDEPSGAHVCISCNRFVHALLQCSIPVDSIDEGYGQKRICGICSAQNPPVAPEVAGAQEVEDWRGLATKQNKKSRAKYLGANTQGIKDGLTWTKHANLPIMKNGLSMRLEAVQLGQKKYSLTNTCAFDSLFQVMLAGASDYSDLRKLVQTSAEKNKLYVLVDRVMVNGLGSQSYRKRTEILVNIFSRVLDTTNSVQNVENKGDIAVIDCNTNIGNMAIQLFEHTPSFSETTQCEKKCKKKTYSLPVGSISDEHLLSKNFTERIRESIFLIGPRQCQTQGCDGIARYVEGMIGDVLLLDVYSTKLTSISVNLNDLPKTIEDPSSSPKGKFTLIGAVLYHGPPVRRRISNDEQKGHYTAVSLRQGKEWVQYDDLLDKAKNVPKKALFNTSLIVYARV